MIVKIPAFYSFWRQRWVVAYGLRDFSRHPPGKAENWAAWLDTLREQMLETKAKLLDK